MVRRHGWQLPAHTFQAFSVFILYVRCTGIDPSDPGILSNPDEESGLNKAQLPEDCQRNESMQQANNDEALFCTLCNAELAVEFGVGVAVLVRCFVDKRDTEALIMKKLGSGFSQAPFATIVDEIVPHLDPGSLPSTVDPDAVENKAIKRPVRISAWKLAKLDSNEAIKAAAKARASSSVLRPINHRNQYETDQCSSGTCALNSYAPSQASREDAETHPQSQSNLGSPVQGSKQHSNTKHFNPIYQQSANHSPLSVKSNDGMDSEHIAVKKSNMNAPVNSRTSVYWDQNAGRFVSSQSTTGSSSQCARTELTYTGHSIFFGGPVLAGNAAKGSGSAGAPNHRLGLGRGRGSDQLPLFVPSDSQKE
ncbi:hypothetical protein J5N97_016489 [Dioscorea zingiberensis]|uniref:Uncharacterized protein n=1 Tax=Dioscorea zingiberensis TaxID=325984 RepID=A0A9D5HFF7_9LILI|nr:hypothetical protein J5N97_016489 [Dioscorea zingiberensis]